MAAPVPGAVPEAAKAVYPQDLRKLIQPLLRHAIRYWELSLKMVEGREWIPSGPKRHEKISNAPVLAARSDRTIALRTPRAPPN